MPPYLVWVPKFIFFFASVEQTCALNTINEKKNGRAGVRLIWVPIHTVSQLKLWIRSVMGWFLKNGSYLPMNHTNSEWLNYVMKTKGLFSFSWDFDSTNKLLLPRSQSQLSIGRGNPSALGSILFCFPIKISVICQGAEDVDILSWICSKLILQT